MTSQLYITNNSDKLKQMLICHCSHVPHTADQQPGEVETDLTALTQLDVKSLGANIHETGSSIQRFFRQHMEVDWANKETRLLPKDQVKELLLVVSLLSLY